MSDGLMAWFSVVVIGRLVGLVVVVMAWLAIVMTGCLVVGVATSRLALIARSCHR